MVVVKVKAEIKVEKITFPSIPRDRFKENEVSE